jgi:L-rhamnose isomerase
MTSEKSKDIINKHYLDAKAKYNSFGVDTDEAIKTLSSIPISLHCWQGDDVSGFEGEGELTGGIMSTGNYPGKATNAAELRQDIDKALSLLPGKQKLNLHAMYPDFNGKVPDRDRITVEHFQTWIDWAKERSMGLDFNPTIFSHDMFKDNMSLTHPDEKVRRFWIDHTKATREIAAEMGRQTGIKCVNNVWIADGMKDTAADKKSFRLRLKDSLDECFEIQFDKEYLLDSVECKLFGIGSESFVPGSHEFYMGYAMSKGIALTLDSGHFHPTETISDKISSVMLFVDEILLHVSRGVRWDSDHIVNLTDDTKLIASECIKNDHNRIHFGLDFFDGTVNRVASWIIGTRAFQKALLIALLEPKDIAKAEQNFDYTVRLALMEEAKQLPWGAVWDKLCTKNDVPAGADWLSDVKQYEIDVQSKR